METSFYLTKMLTMEIGVVTILAIIAVMVATYLMFRVIGTRRRNLLLTAQEKAEWDSTVVPRIGGPLVIASLVGTLTSLATAYLFFIGTSKIFGFWILICPIAIFLGAFVTNWITSRILGNDNLRSRITGSSQQSGVIARLFWSNDPSDIRISRLVKWISVVSITGIIWLEFALFSDVFGALLGIENLFIRALICGFAALVVADFTLRFGLRGFIFADAFHAPLIAIAALVLTGATAWTFLDQATEPISLQNFTALVVPIVDTTTGFLFLGHVLLLNMFLVVFTEAHWLRLWALTEKPVLRKQLAGAGYTAIVWLVLSACGLIAFSLTNEVGIKGVVALLQILSQHGVLVLTMFWLGAAAALFSTADTQIYGLLLVSQFNPNSGKIADRRLDALPSLLIGVAAGLGFFLLYWVVRTNELPFEKIIFIIIPFTLNLLPAFVALLQKRKPSTLLVCVSLLGFVACATIGFLQPSSQFVMTLAASVVPLVVSPFVWLSPQMETRNAHG